MMAVGDFAVQKDTWKGKEVAYYVPKAYGPYARNIFNHTPEMMQFFSDKLGVPYPWDKYSQVVGYNYVSGAMENVTASLFGSFNLKNDRELADAPNDFIVAHELFHQWFGDYVTCESWGQLTVNESFADYSEYLWTEYKYGPYRAEEI
ncbi:Aminopeptidase N [compost metagenome]